MKKRNFIVLFLFLSVSLAFYCNVVANNNADEDKIKTIAQNTSRGVAKKAGDSATAVLNKSKEVAVSIYGSAKEKGSEIIDSMIVEPITKTVKDLTKKALLSIGSSVLTKEEIKDLAGEKSDSCICQ